MDTCIYEGVTTAMHEVAMNGTTGSSTALHTMLSGSMMYTLHEVAMNGTPWEHSIDTYIHISTTTAV